MDKIDIIELLELSLEEAKKELEEKGALSDNTHSKLKRRVKILDISLESKTID